MVDDNTTNLKSAAEVLQPYYKLSMAKSGRQALKFLEKNIPDMILLDIMMPDMDGYQTMEEIKLDPRTANIPIVFLTSDTQQESEIRGIKMGAMDFITKPFVANVMLGRVAQVLQMDEMRRNLLDFPAGNTKSDNLEILEYEAFRNKMKQDIEDGCDAVFLLMERSDEEGIEAFLHTGDYERMKKMFPFAAILKQRQLAFWSRNYQKQQLISILSQVRDSALHVGICDGREAGNDLMEYYLCADKALYHARKSNLSYFFYEK